MSVFIFSMKTGLFSGCVCSLQYFPCQPQVDTQESAVFSTSALASFSVIIMIMWAAVAKR